MQLFLGEITIVNATVYQSLAIRTLAYAKKGLANNMNSLDKGSAKRQRTDSSTSQSAELKYLSGFGNTFKSEALRGALPKGQHNPQRPPYGLYAEQLSGSAFTRPRGLNFRSWLYRIRPSVQHVPFVSVEAPKLVSDFDKDGILDPNQMRWFPPTIPNANEEAMDFVDGLRTMGGGWVSKLKKWFCNTYVRS